MDASGSAAKKAGSSLSAAGTAAQTAAAQHDKLAQSNQKGRKAFDDVSRGAGKVALGVGLIGGVAVKAAADYEQGMNVLQAVSGATGKEMEKLDKLAIKLGADVHLPGTSAKDASEAMTEMIKAGVSLKDTMSGVRGVLVLSAAAGVSNARAAEIASNALNAFKLKGKDVNVVVDQLANTANASSVEINDVADSFKMAAAVFSAFQSPTLGAKKAMTELNVAIGILGNAGIKGSDAGTSLKQALLQLTGPSNKSADAMKALYIAAKDSTASEQDLQMALKGTGKERGEALEKLTAHNKALRNSADIAYTASGKMRSLKDIVKLVSEGTKDMTAQQRNSYLTQIFGADATRAIVVLMKAQNGEWGKMEKAVTRQGAAQELANAKMKGFKGSLEALRSTLETLAIQVGSKLLPALTAMARTFSNILGAVSPTAWVVLIAVIGTLAGTIWTVNAAIKVYEAMTKLAVAAQWLWNAAMSANPIGVVVVALAALAAGAIYAYKHFDGFRAVVDKVWDILGNVFDWIKGHWPLLLAILTGPFGLAALAIVKHAGDIKGAVVAAWNAIKSATTTVWNAIKTYLSALLSAIEAVVTTYFTAYKTVITSAWTAIKTATTAVWGAIKTLLGAAWDGIETLAKSAWDGVRLAVLTPIRAARDALKDIWGTIRETAATAWGHMKDGLGNFAGDVKDKVLSGIKGGLNTLIGFINDVIGVINKIPGVEIGKVKALASGGVNVEGLARGGAFARTGGLVNKPMVMMGEEAPRYPEFVIPTNPAYRKRAQGLLAQASGTLGFAEGGILGSLPGVGGLPDWLKGTGKFVLGKAAGFMKDKFASIFGAPFEAIGDVLKGGTNILQRVVNMVRKAGEISSKGFPYVYGGGHGSFDGPYDCSGAVSAVLHAGGYLNSPITTDGLKVFGESGDGKVITIGVRGSTGANAHTMMRIGNRYFESGSGHGARWVNGWSGDFPIHRHPPGLAKGGILDPTDPRSPLFVGWGLKYGGSFANGGVVPGRVGEPRMIVAHGGERVSKDGGVGNVYIENAHFGSTSDAYLMADRLAWRLSL